MRVLIIGNRGCGKTTAGDLLAFTPPNISRRSVSTSDVLVAKFAEFAHIPTNIIIEDKDQYRNRLWAYGRFLQRDDPLCIVKEALRLATDGASDIGCSTLSSGMAVVTGVRNVDEIEACRTHKLFDVIIWIEREGCISTYTDRITSCDADLIVLNNGTLEELKHNLLGAIQQSL